MSNITLTIPNDDHIALRAFGKALEEMALAHGAQHKTNVEIMASLSRSRSPLRSESDAERNQMEIDETDALERLHIATEELRQAAPRMLQELRCEGEELQGKRKEPEVDTTAQQVESLSDKREEFEQIVDDMKVAASELLNVPTHVLTGQEVPPAADSTGTPWDERIHSTSKALNADGTWRLRRKPKDMDETEWAALVESVKNELNDTQLSDSEFVVDPYDTYEEGELPPVAVVEPPVTPPGDDFHTDTTVVTEQTVAGIPPIPVPPPVVVSTGTTTATLEMHLPTPPHTIPVTAQVVDDWTFPKLMTFLTERQSKIDVPTVNMLLAQDGIASLPELNAHPDKIGPFVARVKAHLGE